MARLLLSILLLNLFALPCIFLFNDDMDNWYLNIVGAIYSYWFFQNIVKNVFK